MLQGLTLSPKCLPCAPEGAHLEHPRRPKPSKYVVLLTGNTHFHKVHKSQLWGTFGTIFGTTASLMEPKVAQGSQRDPKRLPFWSHFPYHFLICVTQAPDGPGRWPQGATASQNDPKMLQKVTPAASKTSKHEPPRASSFSLLETWKAEGMGPTKAIAPFEKHRLLKQRGHQMAPTLANRKSTETKDTHPFETQPDKSKNLCNAPCNASASGVPPHRT